MKSGEIRLLSHHDLTNAVYVMSKAFLYDPLWVYLYKDEKMRKKYLERFFRVFLSVFINKKNVYGIGHPVQAVAVWVIPHNADTKTKSPLRDLLPMMKLFFSPFAFNLFKVSSVFSSFAALEKAYAPNTHYKLESIGVDPDFQGKGLSAKLIAPIISEAQMKNIPVYTETITPLNVGFYEHFGFKTMEERSFPDMKLTVWSFLMK
ncbi:GNAT family N-acetyltransferase [Rossellomorea sp. NS-SX7]|uniref:GNAT family N-acetyltransferase n=1 Tax=Rossellomorea sp. NS-SX7 TaxID=3463856 RepID=UPI004057F5E0